MPNGQKSNDWKIQQRGTQVPVCMSSGDGAANENHIFMVLCSDCAIGGIDYCRWNFMNGNSPSNSFTNLRNKNYKGGNSCIWSLKGDLFTVDSNYPRMNTCIGGPTENLYVDNAPVQ